MNPSGLLPILFALLFAPLLRGLISRTKARFAGRNGAPLLQPYTDLLRLLRKGAVYSRSTGPLFRAAPWAGLAAVLVATALAPIGKTPALFHFSGDLILFAYLLGLGRFLTMAAALDTGSSFEGMGASREAFFSALAEPVLLLALAAFARASGAASLSAVFGGITGANWAAAGPALALAAAALAIVLLAENARIPVDDPNTHLELTMIHEVMVLDHSGPDLAAIEYGASLKLWITGSLLVSALMPLDTGYAALNLTAGLAGMLLLGLGIGALESFMARLRLRVVPQLITGGGALALVALVVLLT